MLLLTVVVVAIVPAAAVVAVCAVDPAGAIHAMAWFPVVIVSMAVVVSGRWQSW